MAGHFDTARQARGGGIRRRNNESKLTKNVFIGVGLVVAWAYIGYATWERVTRQAPREKIVVVKKVEPKVETNRVLIPVVEIQPGDKLRRDMFKVELRPVDKTGSRIISDFEMVRDSYARAAIAAEVPLLRDYVSHVRPLNTVTAQIPDGYRAVTIKVDALSAVEGWARPGARVDVVWTTKYEGKSITTTIVENSEVISSEQERLEDASATEKQDIPSVATLLVKTEDAAKITLAKSTGTVTLSLRGDRDEVGLDDNTITLAQLLKSDVDPETRNVDGMVRIGNSSFTFENGKLVPVDSVVE